MSIAWDRKESAWDRKVSYTLECIKPQLVVALFALGFFQLPARN